MGGVFVGDVDAVRITHFREGCRCGEAEFGRVEVHLVLGFVAGVPRRFRLFGDAGFHNIDELLDRLAVFDLAEDLGGEDGALEVVAERGVERDVDRLHRVCVAQLDHRFCELQAEDSVLHHHACGVFRCDRPEHRQRGLVAEFAEDVRGLRADGWVV